MFASCWNLIRTKRCFFVDSVPTFKWLITTKSEVWAVCFHGICSFRHFKWRMNVSSTENESTANMKRTSKQINMKRHETPQFSTPAILRSARFLELLLIFLIHNSYSLVIHANIHPSAHITTTHSFPYFFLQPDWVQRLRKPDCFCNSNFNTNKS